MPEPQESIVENDGDSQTKGNDNGFNGKPINELKDHHHGKIVQ